MNPIPFPRRHWFRPAMLLACTWSFAVGVHAGPEQGAAGPQTSSSDDGVVVQWLNDVSAIQAEQPHWVTPVVTVTPRLEQEVRYDQFWQAAPGDKMLNSYGGGKGIEFIPTDNVEVILGIPAYQTHGRPVNTGGFADDSFLVKYRILSANEEHGDYILTAFLGVTVPSGDDYNSGRHEVTTPTIAFGKGWGDFDIQSTLGVSVPDNGATKQGAGTPVLFNTALQYRLFHVITPEMEFNYSYFPDGDRTHISQLYLTPGVILGRFDIHKRLGFTIGAGYQVAVTESPAYFHNAILTVRFPF
jgi:opacity protein-like surface antigen